MGDRGNEWRGWLRRGLAVRLWPRHEKGLSQNDLAYEAEVSRSYLSQLEKGAFYASLKIIGRLAEALGVEPTELLKRGAPGNRRS